MSLSLMYDYCAVQLLCFSSANVLFLFRTLISSTAAFPPYLPYILSASITSRYDPGLLDEVLGRSADSKWSRNYVFARIRSHASNCLQISARNYTKSISTITSYHTSKA